MASHQGDNALSLKSLAAFFYPGGAILLLALIFSITSAWTRYLLPLMQILPWLLVVVGAVLAWRFNRTSLLFALAALLLTDVVLRRFGLPSSDYGPVVRNALVLILPLNLLWSACIKERGLLTPRGWLRIALIALQVALVFLFSLGGQDGPARFMSERFVNIEMLDGLRLYQSAVFAWLIGGFALIARYWRKPAALTSGFFWAMLSSFIAVTRFDPGAGESFFICVAGLIIVAGVIEASHALAYRDELTGLPGRRALNEDMLKLGRTYSLAMIDIDHFKHFNDTYGHAAGDQVLKMVASKLARVGGGGRAYRYGGEEFTILFPGRALGEVREHLETLRKAVADDAFVLRNGVRSKSKAGKPSKRKPQQASVTISIGAAEHDNQPAESLMKIADKNLYKAKQLGRNRLCC